MSEPSGLEIAVIGLACRFPGAFDAQYFWENLRSGVESITVLSDRELAECGIGRVTRRQRDYVKAAAVLDDVDRFDAEFFGLSPREARMIDPQHRVFLECAWRALENAGYDTIRYDGAIGLYAGSAMNTYLLFNGRQPHSRDDFLLTVVANDKDFLTSRVSYQLNLTGPAVTVQTACSTALVAVHLACQSLLNGECDMAMAGGVSVRVPHWAGYFHEPGGVLSPDGHTRAFDAKAQGTMFGSGVGVVVLKPLADALTDRDHIHAVIKGTAVNNDGSSKVEYTAPSVGAQAEVVVEALAHAGVDADTISYVEAHGSGTPLGDPIEVAALTKAFRRTTERRGFCALGSVKSNIGHLDAAAGIAGLIKTVLALEQRVIPATLHFEKPNPEIDFAATPFYVNTVPVVWAPRDGPRRAGVSSLGIGGTNAHLIVEQAPPPAATAAGRPFQLLVLSAKTRTALEAATANLAHALHRDPTVDLADAAYTLQVGRRSFGHRRAVVCRSRAEAADALDRLDVRTAWSAPRSRPVVFMFPGGGSQYPQMGRQLYHAEPVFRECVERGLKALSGGPGCELRRLLVAESAELDHALRRPSIQLPAIFLIEVALAHLWRSWGVRPAALIGHSMGEITAAHVAGVLSFDDALALIATRGELVESAASGEMLSVSLDEHDIDSLLTDQLDLAAVNAPGTCVVSGPGPAIDALARQLAARKIQASRVPIATAAHSQLLDPVLSRFTAGLNGVRLDAPSIPFISNLTGTWITVRQATDPAYWARQLRSTVRFADGVRELLMHTDRWFLEVGPSENLSAFVRLHPGAAGERTIASLRQHSAYGSELASVLDALGRLWLAGVEVDWAGFTANERRCRIPLPTYPFEGQRHWLDSAVGMDGPKEWFRSALHRVLWRDGGRPQRRTRQTTEAGAVAATAAPTGGGGGLAGGPPRTAVERELADMLQKALGIPRIGIHDDFFALGGTSLLATEAIAHINKTCGVELTALTVLESPTVASLAERLESAKRAVKCQRT